MGRGSLFSSKVADRESALWKQGWNRGDYGCFSQSETGSVYIWDLWYIDEEEDNRGPLNTHLDLSHTQIYHIPSAHGWADTTVTYLVLLFSKYLASVWYLGWTPTTAVYLKCHYVTCLVYSSTNMLWNKLINASADVSHINSSHSLIMQTRTRTPR